MKLKEYNIPTCIFQLLTDIPDTYDAKKILLVAGIGIGSTWAIKQALNWIEWWQLQQRRDRKREECASSLKALRDSLPTSQEVLKRQEEIMKLPLNVLLEQLRDERLTPVEVLEAFQRAALKAHEKTNCLIEPIKEAKVWAKELEGRPKGLLYGLPIALKDDYCVKGYDSTVGMSHNIDRPCTADGILVKALKAEGAIPFVKTNVPQTMCSFMTSNPIFGTTVTPFDLTRTCGGSSGGTAALIAAGGALVGTGSDFAGSVRNPAAFNGLFGFKASSGRVSMKNMRMPMASIGNMVPVSYGPLSTSFDGIILFFKCLWSGTLFEEDPSTVPLPFQDNMFNSRAPLRIGYYVDDGYFRVPPACERAVYEAKTALERGGHTLVPFSPPDVKEFIPYYHYMTVVGEGGKALTEALRNDAVDPRAFGPTIFVLNLPTLVKKALAIITKPFSRSLAEYFRYACGIDTVSQWWSDSMQYAMLRSKFFEEWKKLQLDGMLCPAFGIHTVSVDSRIVVHAASSYTALYNALDCPAGVVPVTTVTEEDENKAMIHYPEEDELQRMAKKEMENSVGLPVGVQCVALPFRDELCLRIMSDLNKNLK